MVWLTPAMDGLFLGAASERRRFFDRLVLAIDSEHSSRVSALERSLRSRNRLLEVRNYDDHWCDAIERETAELAVRRRHPRPDGDATGGDAARTRQASAFPSAQIMLDGWMENALVNESATAAEDRYRESCVPAAPHAAAGRTLDRPPIHLAGGLCAEWRAGAPTPPPGGKLRFGRAESAGHCHPRWEVARRGPLLLLDEVGRRSRCRQRNRLFKRSQQSSTPRCG